MPRIRSITLALLMAGLLAAVPSQSAPVEAEVPPTPVHAEVPPTPVHYVVFGDSVTHGGYGVDPGGRAWRARFDADVTAATGVAPVGTVLAVGGWSTADVLPQAAAVLLDAEARRHIDLVIVMLGTNDAAGSIPAAEARYSRLVATVLDGTPQTTKVALTFIQISAPPAPPALIVGETAMRDATFRVGAAWGWTTPTPGPRFAGWIDLAPGSGAPTLSGDGIHPDAAGYDRIGDIVYDSVCGPLGLPVR